MDQKLRGLVGQGMDGRKRLTGGLVKPLGVLNATTGTGTFIATHRGAAFIYLFGAGGGGQNGPNGGGGGAALFKQLRVDRGQTFSYSVGALGLGGPASSEQDGTDGGDTVVVCPDKAILIAGGGKGGGLVGGMGGKATGGDVNRDGGNGGTGSQSGGDAGIGGGMGGTFGGSGDGGGGGGAGFGEIGLDLAGGAGGNGALSAGANYGGGGGSQRGVVGGRNGGLGRVLIWLFRTY